MNIESFIGVRYLKARKSSAFASTITLIATGGVAVGVAALIVVLCVMAGFEEELRDKIIGASAHGRLTKTVGVFTEYRDVLKVIEAHEEVMAASPFATSEIMLSSETNVSGAVLKGLDVATYESVMEINESIVEGKMEYLTDAEALMKETKAELDARVLKGDYVANYASRAKKKYGDKPLPGIAIGKELAKFLGVWVGDEINVVNPLGGGMGPTGPIPSSKYFRVAAVFFLGMYEYDMKYAYVTLEQLQKFSGLQDEATAIEFRVKETSLFETERIGGEILADLNGEGYEIKDWKALNESLFAALKVEQLAMFIILTFITLVAAFNIASMLIMMVIEKNKEISILKSMGADKGAIMKIFIISGGIVGLIGTLIGAVIGFILLSLIPVLDFQLDPEVYYMTNIPVNIQPVQIGGIVLSAIIISLLATIYPSLQAANLNPVEGLRDE